MSTLSFAPPAFDRAPAAGLEARERLFALIESELALPPRSVSPDTPIASLGDSLDWLELLMAVEDLFGLSIEPAQTRAMRSVGDLLRLCTAAPGAR